MAVGGYEDGENTYFQQGLFEESATAKHRLGTVRRLDDGRVFRYCSVTAAAIAAGLCVSKASAPVAATIAAADAALAIAGAKEISMTIAGATAALYKDGYAVVSSGTNIGAIYKIRGNGATDGIATGRASFSLYDEIAVTWVAASTTVNVYPNPYSNLLINPAVAGDTATTQETVMGVTTRAVGNATAVSYLWIQVHGMASMVLDIDAAAGGEANEMWIIPGTTTGRGLVVADTARTGNQLLGVIYQSADLTDASANLVHLLIE